MPPRHPTYEINPGQPPPHLKRPGGMGVGHMDAPHPHATLFVGGACPPPHPHTTLAPTWEEGGMWAWGWTHPTPMPPSLWVGCVHPHTPTLPSPPCERRGACGHGGGCAPHPWHPP